MTLLIGLDGGGTGSRARALRNGRAAGDVMEGGSANIHSDPAGATQRIADLLARVRKAAGHDDPTDPDLHIVLGLAGASESGAAARLTAALPYRNVTVLGDVDISLSGAFQDDDGIVMAVGTGSVLARQANGQMQRVGGYGFALGDEAGGAWLGRRALAMALHVRDGLVDDAPLARTIWARFETLAALLDFISTARPSDYAAIAPQVVAQDSSGCPLAQAILDEGCDYLLRAIRHLQAGDSAVPVAATGGLGPLLLERIARKASPALTVTTPKGTALDGALWRARQLAATKGPKA
ncbi:MAG: glucosamine kinase GspK [Roseibaca calidilacus]|uniref:Glucosamine kinase n=2 Tax=Roseibaca calidilacus TaxID=1666912 RepID=A0A0P7WU55_9RHOB|nr:MAG: glucosamine kinase GspK [Roseibaca calidilacus]CUX83248.1 glucosamine kinase [Roseibaca calidilacus]